MGKVKVSITEDNKVTRDNVAKFISFHEEFELGSIYEMKKNKATKKAKNVLFTGMV